MYALYSLLLAVGFILCIPWFAWRGWWTGRYFGSFRARLGRRTPAGPRGAPKSIWVHAVSVGEVIAARPLLAALRLRFSGLRLFVTTTTITGQAVARRGTDVDGVLYAPFDFPGPVRRTLDALDPALLVLVETELWPNLIHETRRRGARVALVNGRISPRSFARYSRVRPLMRRLLGEVDLFLMQSEPHAERARGLGAPGERVRVSGNLKFDAAPAPAPSGDLSRALAPLAGRPLWVAGSTVSGEETLVLEAFGELRARFPDAGLLLAPRHPERFLEVATLIEAAGYRCWRRSQPGAAPDARDVLLLDTLGELAQVYPLATVAFVGGSLVPAGGHNVLEAAMAGRAVVVGQHMENFSEIAEAFRAEQALVQVASAGDLAGAVAELMADEGRRRELGDRARALVERNRGAVQRTVEALAPLVA